MKQRFPLLLLAIGAVVASVYGVVTHVRHTAPEIQSNAVIIGNCDASPSGPVKPGCSPIVPYDRLAYFQPGVTYNGGIPARTTVCATVPPTGNPTGDSDAIQAAINACPPNETVMLTAGTYQFALNDNVGITQSNVTVRGTVDGNGRPTSNFALNSQFAPFEVLVNGTQASEAYYCQPNALTADVVAGSHVVHLASSIAYTVGELVTLNQLYDPDIWWYDSFKFGTNVLPPGSTDAGNPGTELERNFASEWDRPQGQILEVASVSGTTVTFTTQIHSTFTVANQAHIIRHSSTPATTCTPITTPISGVGIENLYFYGLPTDAGASTEENGAIFFLNAKRSWMKNIEVFNWTGTAIGVERCLQCEMRDSYLHQTYQPNPGGGGYAMAIDWESADTLVENNIMWAVNKVEVMRSAGGGNVIAYNYMEDGFGAGYQTQPETGANASHMLGNVYDLFEGNQAWNFAGDSVWGNSHNILFFRNHATCLRRNVPGVTSCGAAGTPMNFQQDVGGRTCVTPSPMHNQYSFVGNVYGYSGEPDASAAWIYAANSCTPVFPSVYNLGTDSNGLGADAAQCALPVLTALEQGNFDWPVNQAAVWDPSIKNRVIPNSLYLSGPPAFFGSNTWPWVNPYTGVFPQCAGDYCLPARQRFDTMIAAGASPCASCLWRN